MSESATLTWFARHEFRLAWRDWLSMMTAGKRGRERVVVAVLAVFVGCMHLFAYSMVVAGLAQSGSRRTRLRWWRSAAACCSPSR